jgi:hypothetical protein
MNPFMKYVIRKTTGDMYGAMWLLECGHEAYRYGTRKPTRLKCLKCEWRAERDAEEAQKQMQAVTS